MITSLIQTATRHLLNVETEGAGVAAVEVTHERIPLEERERIHVTVQVDDDNVEVITTVRAS